MNLQDQKQKRKLLQFLEGEHTSYNRSNALKQEQLKKIKKK